jgi:hypothetical protein
MDSPEVICLICLPGRTIMLVIKPLSFLSLFSLTFLSYFPSYLPFAFSSLPSAFFSLPPSLPPSLFPYSLLFPFFRTTFSPFLHAIKAGSCRPWSFWGSYILEGLSGFPLYISEIQRYALWAPIYCRVSGFLGSWLRSWYCLQPHRDRNPPINSYHLPLLSGFKSMIHLLFESATSTVDHSHGV